MFKNFIIKILLGKIADKLDGYKTIIGFVATVMYALVCVVGIMFPEYNVAHSQLTLEQLWDIVEKGAILTWPGLAHKAVKGRAHMQEVISDPLDTGKLGT